MKTGLIMVLSALQEPYYKLANTSQKTWDSEPVENMETIFYFGRSDKKNSDTTIYCPVDEDFFNIGYKNFYAFKWALEYKKWDYMIRPNASCYVHKTRLLNYIQTLPESNVYAGLRVCSVQPNYIWGPCIIMSRDVVSKIVDNTDKWNHSLIEDQAMSYVVHELNIPYMTGPQTGLGICAIEQCQDDKKWRLISYLNSGYSFSDFRELQNDKDHFLFRCKHESDRDIDTHIMYQLFNNLHHNIK